MRKQTAPHTRKRRRASAPKQPGLIAQSLHARQPATPDSALDNHSHRTELSPTAISTSHGPQVRVPFLVGTLLSSPSLHEHHTLHQDAPLAELGCEEVCVSRGTSEPATPRLPGEWCSRHRGWLTFQ